MNSPEARVTACFLNVFPSLDAARIAEASTDTLEAWDSVTHITLLSALSEEFGIEFEPEEYVELVSYTLIVNALKERTA